MAALSRMSRGEHRSITLTRGDLIIMSSSQIPGNEEAIFGVLDSLAKIGVRVVTNGQVRIHVSGHAYAGELLFLYNGVRPRNVMPVHGTWRHLRANAALAVKSGVPEEIDRAGRERRQRRPGRRQGVASRARCRSARCSSTAWSPATSAMPRWANGSRCHRVSSPSPSSSRRGTGKLAAPPHLHSRGFSEDPKALEPAARKVAGGTGNPCRGEGHRPDADRAGRASRGRQVGGRDLPPSADDRADGARDRLGLRGRYGRPLQLRRSVEVRDPAGLRRSGLM